MRGGERGLVGCLTALTAGVAAVVFFGVAPFDPDPHHDGVQFAAAAGVADGLHLFTQVFDQYGPLTAWLQGLVLWVFGDRLLVLRQLNAALLTITAILLLLIVRRVSGSVALGAITAIAWVAFCPDWSVFPGAFPLWPWPSVVLLVATLAAVYAIIARSSGWLQTIAPFAAGIASGAAVCARWPSGIVLIAIIGLWLALRAWNGSDEWKRFGLWAGGAMVSITAALLYLMETGAVREMVYQTITQPFNVYGSATGIDYWVTTYGVGAVAACLTGLAAFVVVKSTHRSLRGLAGLVCLCAAGALIAACAPDGLPSARVASWSGSLRLATASDIQAMGPLYAAIVVTPIMALAFLCRHRLAAIRATITDRRALLGAAACASILQLYPIADPYHLWWAAPLPLGFAVAFAAERVRGSEWRSATLGVLALMPFVLVSSIGLARDLTVSRVEVSSGALAGMKVRPEFVPMIEEVDAALAAIPAGATVDFSCRDGLVAAWEGGYRAGSARYVAWAWIQEEEVRPSAGPRYLVYCAETPSSAPVGRPESGIELVRAAQQYVHISSFSGFYPYVYRQVP